MGLLGKFAGFLGGAERPNHERGFIAPPDEPPHEPPADRRPTDLDDIREPAIWLKRIPGRSSLSRFGGLPSLPPTIPWPVNPQTGFALHFLAQIDLSALPPTPFPGRPWSPGLPRAGMLFFFADMEEEMLWSDRGERDLTRVIFAPMAGPLVRKAPASLPMIGHSYEEMAGQFACGKSRFSMMPVQPYLIDTFPGAELYFQGQASFEADRRTLRSIERATGERVPVMSSEEAFDGPLPAAVVVDYPGVLGGEPRFEISMNRHQMLGAAIDVQGTAEEMRERGNVLLLQIDSDFAVDENFMFCDMGMAQFWITPEDLRTRRFDRAWGTTEGG